MITETDMKHLRRCVELARIALEKGDEPFGSVLVSAEGEVLFEDHNHVAGGDYTQHPEFAIARWAAQHMTPEARARATDIRGALPDVRRRPRLGRPGPDRVRQLVPAIGRVAGRMGSSAVPRKELAHPGSHPRRASGGTRSRAGGAGARASPAAPRGQTLKMWRRLWRRKARAGGGRNDGWKRSLRWAAS